ncbi:murein hydrolase activator EnvC family protein [Schleiferia thermophila]|jgi:murein DD-endopeptidase MepM/ murein hydrolase activator NlpD|uniref:Peptidase M23-like protein n=1 Tax=Schleiferia thermophila TaxID=884107 RepID=A0A369AB46_9FLAO|nr:M23 family metallopeptidase [Schleiferia thermophila]KFD39900.1 peptidase M23 [Schleiferia thermophila str. Yellowstone]PMB17262.1 M23 family peptidase [Fischerella thermalis CCMEE 5319]RCX05297.1 peptidase M23-like protein [Schleiferia thermophila]GCD79194.1 peptidase M23 [Schleiferia thermophila]
MSLRNRLKKSFKNRYRLVILNDENFEERFSVKLTKPLVFSLVAGGSLLLVIATTFIIAFTPLREYIPGYSSTELKRLAIQNAAAIDSLERQLQYAENYLTVLKSVISGEIQPDDSTDIKMLAETSVQIDLTIGKHDSLLRYEIEQEEQFNLQPVSREQFFSALLLFPPVRGVVVAGFDPEQKNYHIEITTTNSESVKSVYDGVVVFADFNPVWNHVVIIQHSNDLISVYRNLAFPLKRKGQNVRAGEVISFVESTREFDSKPIFAFELWQKGQPMNPQLFINF